MKELEQIIEQQRKEIKELKEELAMFKEDSENYYDILVDIYDRLKRTI